MKGKCCEMEKIIIVGFGAHGRTVADSIKIAGRYEIAGYTDSKENVNCAYTYLGTDDMLEELYASGIKNAVVGVGQMDTPIIRKKIYDKLKKIGYELPVIIDPSAVLSSDISVAEGTFIGKSVVIETGSCVGKMCIINTCAMISHDGKVGDFTHISGHTNICGGASVGEESFVGAAATVISNVSVGNNVLVGAGTVVVKNVENNMKVFNKIVPVISERK